MKNCTRNLTEKSGLVVKVLLACVLALYTVPFLSTPCAYADSLSESEDASWMSSYRFDSGELMPSYSTQYGSSTFMKFNQGHHQDSDALCGIDVSTWQKNINWKKVRAAGIDFAIVRSSYGFSGIDDCFVNNVKGCMENNIAFGVYHYAKATNAAEAVTEANLVKSRLSAAGVTPDNISFPIYYDVENSNTSIGPNYWDYGAGVVDTIVQTFISEMNKAGYKAGVYSSKYWYTSGPCSSSYINSLEYRWVAQYNESMGLEYEGFGKSSSALKNDANGIWQFSSSGSVDGISVDVDLNYSYYNDHDGIKMYRIYNPYSGEHFYTSNSYERSLLFKAGWEYEGIGWYAPTYSNTPVYRLYSGSDHHYTTSQIERDSLIDSGWKYEGVGWYSDDAQGVALYRQFNPYVNPNAYYNNSGSHNYTMNKVENDWLVSQGWREEGIGWYGLL